MSHLLDEPLRLAHLEATELLDTERDPVFDELTRVAALALGATGALLTLVTNERQWFKSSFGLGEPWTSRRETPLSHSFCQHVVTSGRPLVVPDARADPLVRDNPAVEEMGVAAYLGVPLGDEGDAPVVGTFAVFHTVPRTWSARDVELTQGFARVALAAVRRHAEVVRREHATAQLEALLAHLPSAVLSVSTDGRVLYANRLAHTFWGGQWPGGRLGEWIAGVTDTRGRPLVRDDLPLMRALRRGESASRVDYTMRDAEGRERVVRASAAPVTTASGVRIGAVLIADDVTEEAAAERRRRDDEERMRSLHAASPVGIFEADARGRVTYVNDRLLQIWHATEAQVRGVGAVTRIHPDDRPAVAERWLAALAAGAEYEHEYRLLLDDGAVRWVHARAAPRRDAEGRVAGAVGTIEDLTERRAVQEQFVQAQKMEAIGRLAGGVAHDFNNLLTVIRAAAEFLLERLPAGSEERRDAEDIRAAADRAAGLTRRLLAYSRRQLLRTAAVDVNDAVRGVETLLRRVIGEDVSLVTDLAPDVGAVVVDHAQLEQVLVNLAVNARDAMPRGGTLAISTSRAREAGGDTVVVAVADTGVGMDEATLRRACEPFFTTKGPEEGTGLGLSMVEGVVAQAGGAVRIESAAGLGTRVRLSFPAAAEAVPPLAAGERPAPARGGGETVLLVEDDPGVRRALGRVLTSLGYRVVEADAADTALALWPELAAGAAPGRRRVAALVTDVVMPGLDGGELARRLRAVEPTLPVLFLSGYTDRPLPADLLDPAPDRAPAAMLPKPVTADALAAALAGLVGRRGEREVTER